MSESFGTEKERPLIIGYDAFSELYRSNVESAFAENINALAEDLITKGDAERMMQEGAELDRAYLQLIEAIGEYLKSENFEYEDLASVEAMALQLIDEMKGEDERFSAYVQYIKAGNSKLKGMR